MFNRVCASDCLCTCGDQPTVELRHRLLVHQLSVGRNDVVLRPERADGTLGRQGLLTQIPQPFMQPRGRCAIGFELRVELIDDIGIRDRVGDLGRPFRVARVVFDLDNVAEADILQ